MITMATLEKGDTPESLAQKESNYVSTGFAFLGLLSTGLARPKSINIFDELNAMPETTPAQILAKKQRARELKNLDIAQAKRGNSWLAHAIPAVLASIAGTSLAIRHEDPWIGLKSFALTVIVTEIRIGLRPEFSESSTSERAGVFSSPLIDTLSVVPYYPNDGAGQGLSLVGRF
jgi:hypothetical protein